MAWRCQPVSAPGGKRHSVTFTFSLSIWIVGIAGGRFLGSLFFLWGWGPFGPLVPNPPPFLFPNPPAGERSSGGPASRRESNVRPPRTHPARRVHNDSLCR